MVESIGIVFCEGTLHPRYIMDRGFIEVRLNTRRHCVILQTRGGREQAIGPCARHWLSRRNGSRRHSSGPQWRRKARPACGGWQSYWNQRSHFGDAVRPRISVNQTFLPVY